MKTYKLWLEPDHDIPEFKRLKCDIVDHPIQDIIRRGLHPEKLSANGRNYDSCQLNARITEIINVKEYKIIELVEAGYCDDISEYNSYYYSRDVCMENIQKISESIYFVDKLDYPTLLTIARRQLVEAWSHTTALELAQSIYHEFNDLRSFLKFKDKKLKLSGYKDISNYELDKVLSLDDFEGQDKALIANGISSRNFRNSTFLDSITTSDGYLSLKDSFDQFSINLKNNKRENNRNLTFHCKRNGDRILVMPDIDDCDEQRLIAKKFARRWGNNSSKICFHVTLDKLAEMIKRSDISISFDGTRYKDEDCTDVSSIRLNGVQVERYSVGRYLTSEDTNEAIKDLLRNHNVSMTGKKTELIKKMAGLVARLYNAYNASLDRHFQKQKYIKIPRINHTRVPALPVLQELELGQMLIAMYIIKHLRGNAILDPTHDNNTYELKDLAYALITKKINVNGIFIKTIK